MHKWVKTCENDTSLLSCPCTGVLECRSLFVSTRRCTGGTLSCSRGPDKVALWRRKQSAFFPTSPLLKLGPDDRNLEGYLARSGCEVHCFDPSLKQAHQQRNAMWLHRLSVDWRDPNPAVSAQRQYTKKLATILNDFGHRRVDVLKADMESAEWKILENLILEGVLDSVGQLLLEVHLHWAGFEVPGDDPSVVRYWFSLLKELEHADFRLFRVHSDPAQPHIFLRKNVLNASSAYTFAWVNTRRRP
ncbi:probable methyltransferase-like protein 24 isoform X3 [Phyllopteryx taeniolatus]|uniref:probable methyltransferase-like protein 24 isoform X3 n=1 Tax=Phyllopteryx taeniolatus TaxID=161469 RepID=UPI002AD3C796|nr:probable methyltransferase-like protein 24 isoform X3 [Phyllopteryx taeniolatus]